MTTFNNMDLNLLRVFQAIADERSLTLAGHRLHISQPAVSSALARLRVAFNDPLFIRTKDGMSPTATGAELAKPIGRALQAVQEALRYGEEFDPATCTRTFRMSMTDVAEMEFLPHICEKLKDLGPRIKLQVEQLPPSQIEGALKTGQLDFAIGDLPVLKPLTRFEFLFRDSYVCMTRKRAGLPQRRHLTLAEFLAMTHVVVKSVECSHVQLESEFKSNNIHREITLEAPHFSVLPRILARSDLAATLPRGSANVFNEDGRLAVYELPVALPTVDITLHWHGDFDADPGAKWMRELFIDLMRRKDVAGEFTYAS
ncbi:LysR family transcriptional regulator [Herbaspirillum lusitanum]|uniref:LysR family transcriptional regulator n=1 Tax=Herbaspirillum lusitanum TaxID=213312 RepID=A0ABW9A9N6_9BURK